MSGAGDMARRRAPATRVQQHLSSNKYEIYIWLNSQYQITMKPVWSEIIVG